MDNKERLDLLNTSYQKLLAHSQTIQNCSKQADDLLSRLEQIKQKLIKKEGDVADDFKEIHEQHIQNTQYIEQLELYENESISFKQTIDRICGEPLSDPIWFQHLKKKYLNKAILYELYRQGRFKAAQLFIQETKLKEPKQDKQKFIKLHSILYAMDQFDIQPALNWIVENEKKEEKKDEDNDEDDHKEKQKDINFTSKYDLSKYSDILRFLLHRDKFLHISAIGSKQEMHCYMRSELEKLRNIKYNNTYSQEIINNLHYEASSIAYYVDDWKLLYYLKIFPNIKLNEIPVTLNAESFQKYCNVIEKCKLKNEQKDDAEIKDNNTEETNINNDTNDVEMTVINHNKKRKHMNDTSEDKFDENLNINNNIISPRKKRKISEKSCINNADDKYNVCHLVQDENREYLSIVEKLAIYESFEFPQLISSVWNLSRKAFMSAFISLELDLPTMSGIQSCVELSLNIFPKFRDIPNDISGDFDDILTLYKDFNKERSIRSRVPFTNALIAHSDDTAVSSQNGVSLNISSVFKWEDYDTLGEDESSSEDGNISRSQSHSRSRSHSDGDACVGFDLFKKDDEVHVQGGKKGKSKKSKQQKGRFRIHSEDSVKSKVKSSSSRVVKKLKYQDDDDKEDNKGDDMDEDDDGGSDEYDYGDYDDASNDIRIKEEDMCGVGVDGYIGYMNRKEFRLDMKKRRIIRRSKNKEYKDRMDKYGTAEFLYNQIHPFIEPPNKKKRSKHKLTRPTTIILSNRSRTHRYDSRGVQRPHSLPSSQRHRSRIQPASSIHRIRTQTTPPPPSDSDAAEEAFILHRNLNIGQQLNIPHLHRAARPSSAQSATTADNDNDEVFTHIRRSQHRRLYSQNLVHRSIQQQFSPPPSNHAPLLLGTESLLAPRVVNENEANNDDLVGFDGDLSSMLNPSIFASRSSSPLSSQLTGMTLEHLSMTNNPPSTNANTESVGDEDRSTNNDDMAAQALLLLKNSKQNESNDTGDIAVMNNTPKKENTKHKTGHKNKNDKEEIDDDDAKSMEIDNENETNGSYRTKSNENNPKNQINNLNAVCNIDWENESDSSEAEERYLTQKDKDILRNEQRRLKISCKMSEDFKMPDGYLSHSIFVCPIQTDYVPDPQTKLGCGHLISYQTFVRLQNMQRQRHQENRNRPLKIHCPNCDQQSDVEKDVRYVYLGRFPDLRVDSRFTDILDKKLDANATKWVPGATQINGQE